MMPTMAEKPFTVLNLTRYPFLWRWSSRPSPPLTWQQPRTPPPGSSNCGGRVEGAIKSPIRTSFFSYSIYSISKRRIPFRHPPFEDSTGMMKSSSSSSSSRRSVILVSLISLWLLLGVSAQQNLNIWLVVSSSITYYYYCYY